MVMQTQTDGHSPTVLYLLALPGDYTCVGRRQFDLSSVQLTLAGVDSILWRVSSFSSDLFFVIEFFSECL
jgi:hypothetical protein